MAHMTFFRHVRHSFFINVKRDVKSSASDDAEVKNPFFSAQNEKYGAPFGVPYFWLMTVILIQNLLSAATIT